MFALQRRALWGHDCIACNLLLATSASGWPRVAVHLRAHPRRSLHIRTTSHTSARRQCILHVCNFVSRADVAICVTSLQKSSAISTGNSL